MKIRLDKIDAEPLTWQETVLIPAASLERTRLLDLSDISWTGEVWKDSPGYQLAASFAYEQTVACDRCLTAIALGVEGEVRLRLVTDAAQSTEEEVELSAEDLEIFYLKGDELEPEQVLVEQLQLNVPMRAICRDDCQGLCPDCGVNRNIENCDCNEARIDPRWEALRGLKGEN